MTDTPKKLNLYDRFWMWHNTYPNGQMFNAVLWS
jgi:hypothetical protein